ncbi:probable phosphatase C1687.21 [Pollicipes pollicipes]|uniref:probable phosphatase C1687.21 n=1 Tax=Pollicipes pollicipes TaxID=41117 RepID=UPI001884D0BF|nr:probable phosphatase C1687.21 [Pollicipes pollicipes]
MATSFHLRLIRHGETDANVQELVEAHTPTPLNATGRRQAEALGAALAAEGATFVLVVSSDTQRARETCERALGTAVAASARLEPLVRERESGPLHGLTYAEATRLQAEARSSGQPLAGLESVADARKRAATFFERLVREMTDDGGSGGSGSGGGGEVVVFSHAGLIHLLLLHLQQQHGLLLLQRHLTAGPQLHFSWNTGQTRLLVRRGEAGELTVECEYLHRDDHLTAGLAPSSYLMQDGSRQPRDGVDAAAQPITHSLV